MIANITKGRRAQGALIYDFGPGRKEEHVDPRFIAGNVPGTRQQVARIIDHHTRQGELTKPLWRCSLSLPDEDGVLPDSTWSQMAERFITKMGFADCPWVAVRHGDDHIHLTVSRLSWDGTTASDQWDYARARKIADAIEQDHGLVAARSRFKKEGPGVASGDELAASKRRGQDQPERLQLRELVRAARAVAAGQGREGFERELAAAGVGYRANVASTGRMNGYSFSLPGWTSEAGPIWVTASSMGKDLGWKQLSVVLGDGPAPAPAPAAPEPLRPEQDLARRTLERYRAAARGEQVDVDHGDYDLMPPQRPTFPHMLERRYGALAGTDLVRHLKVAQDDLPRRRAHLASMTGTLNEVEAAAAGTGPGRELRALVDRVRQLEKAAALLDQADEHKATADQALERASQARAEARAAHAEASKPTRFGVGRGRQEKQRALYAAAIGRAEQADRDWSTAHFQEANARQAAPKENTPRQTLAELTPVLPELEARARAADQAHARRRLDPARQDVDHAQRRLDQTVNAIEGLLAEQQLRTQMPKDLVTKEAAVRREVALRQRAAAASKASPSRRAAGKKAAAPKKPPPEVRRRPPEPPQPGRGSPGIGR